MRKRRSVRQTVKNEPSAVDGGAGPALIDFELSIPDYRASFRPSRIIDLMHEAVSSYAVDAIAFYPLMDAIILLFAKPIALVFHRSFEAHGPPLPFFVTYPEENPVNLARRFASKRDFAETLVPFPQPPGQPAKEQLFVSLADILEVDDPAGEQPKKLLVEPHRVRADEVNPKTSPEQLHAQQLDLWLLRRLFLELDQTAREGSRLSTRVLAILGSELEERSTRRSVIKAGAEEPPWAESDLPAWIAVADQVLSEHWRQIADEALPREPVGTDQPARALDTALRFLLIMRFALPGALLRCKAYTYGARIVLGRRQLARIREWLSSEPDFRNTEHGSSTEKRNKYRDFFGGDANAVLSALELPLGLNYRSISDTHFGSGFIDFAPEATFARPGQRSGPASKNMSEPSARIADAEHASDTRRKAAELLVLDERGSRVFYVPIHVGGIPWLGLLVLDDQQKGSDVPDATWSECYHLYRGIVTTVGQQIRLSSRKAYSAALSSVLLQQLSDPRPARNPVDEINRQWSRLSAFFPYDAVRLEPAQPGDSDVIDLPSGEQVALKSSTNPHACFSHPLNFDRLPLPAVHHELVSMMDTVVAKRLSAMARQESAWAHDVKNWTLPILKDLTAVLQESELGSSAAQHVYTALVYARILNATAFARQTASDEQRSGSPAHNALSHYFALVRSEPELERLLRLAADLLLTTHGEIPKNRSAFELVWPGKRPLREVMQDLANLVAAKATSPSDQETLSVDPTSVIGFPIIIWPLSLLREVIQNIKINNPLQQHGNQSRRIEIDYSFEHRDDRVVMIITQTNYERVPWEENFPQGIRKANLLYGPMGANIGFINEHLALDQSEVALEDEGGEEISAVKVEYSVCVEFFLGAVHGRPDHTPNPSDHH